MKINSLPSLEYLNECFELSESSPSGLIWKRDEPKGRNGKGKVAGRLKASGYYVVFILGKEYRTHRIIYSMYHQESVDGKIVDHKDGCSYNNLITNLRIATHQENQWNAGVAKNNTSGHKGIRINKLKNNRASYTAKIRINGKYIKIGTFRDFDEAKEKYKQYVDEHLRDFVSTRLEIHSK